MNEEKKVDFAQAKTEIETGTPTKSAIEDSDGAIPSDQPYPPAFQPIFDAHDFIADLYDQIPAANRWKRLAMRKALLNPKLRKAEEAVSEQCRIVLDDRRPTRERDLATRRIAEGMQYWQQLILGRS